MSFIYLALRNLLNGQLVSPTTKTDQVDYCGHGYILLIELVTCEQKNMKG